MLGVRARRAGRSAAKRYLLDDIKRVHRDTCGRCGSPRNHEELKALGPRRSRGRIERLMRQHARGSAGAHFHLSGYDHGADVVGVAYILKAIPEETSTLGHRRENTPKPTLIRPDFISEVNH
jgi:hypothetical protein